MSEYQPRMPVVGIGASAGGIEALELFFRATPANSGLAFVVVTHLSPERESLLAEVVARFTDMPVENAQDGVELQPNKVFVLPENAIIGVQQGRLQVTRMDNTRRERKPIDIFLSALATDMGEYAVGVILSGGDGDGTLGAKAIKERGGLTMAQVGDGDGPKHPSMPQSAIAVGMIDFALPADEMPGKLIRFFKGLGMLDGMADAEREAENERISQAHKEIYGLLRNQTGHDFSGYKNKTFARRVQRRMHVLQLDTVEGYIEALRRDPAEILCLFRDLLINVTNFFRDQGAFDALQAQIIPKLFEGRGADDTVRVWVPGCATGEEVYSIAILMREHMDTLRASPRVQIFATDIDDRSLSAARAARYPEALVETISPERLSRFFHADGGSYVVAKDVRDLCIFSPHSVIRDPPFSRMDLVSCRNLLIYFGPDIQSQVIPTFHYSLRPNGFLFLGTSENVSQFSDLFTPLDKKHRIFRARDDARAAVRVPLILNGLASISPPAAFQRRETVNMVSMRQTIDTHVIEQFAPAHVVVNAEGDVVLYSGRTGKYLEPSAGAPSRQLLPMARKGLRLELRSALREALESRTRVHREKVPVETDDDRVQMVGLTIDPVGHRHSDEPLFLVLFSDTGPSLSREDAAGYPHTDRDHTVAQMEQELRETRDRLQSMVEEYETALEELKSSNEELVSVNEELQSTNEELEASKEELQSLNEELHTVNIELNHKVDALDQSNSDLRNVFESTQIAMVFLDHDLVIRNFTPSIADLFNILPSDRGRPLTDFTSKLNYPALHDDIRKVLATGKPIETRADSQDGRVHYMARLRPYLAAGGDKQGVIITFFDVTLMTQAEAHQQVLIAELNHRVKNMLTVAIGIAAQTAKGAVSAPDYSEALISRLRSMARAYELLARDSWTQARITELLHQELDPFGPDCMRLSGPDITLEPRTALSLGMIVHELATNALKYGALSSPEGKVNVDWEVTQADSLKQQFRLTWREQDGPEVTEASRRGFGLKLIEREVSYGLKGKSEVRWERSGLQTELSFPLP